MTELPITNWLQKSAEGDQRAAEQVAEWAYAELQQLARARMRRSFRGREVTLEPAGLVNETFLKVLKHPVGFANRRHFFAFMSSVMMRVLIDYQRSRNADKRSVDRVTVELEGLAGSGRSTPVDVIAVDQLFTHLESHDRRKAEVARLRALWGLQVPEVAAMLEVSEPTVIRDWRFARNWLADQLEISVD